MTWITNQTTEEIEQALQKAKKELKQINERRMELIEDIDAYNLLLLFKTIKEENNMSTVFRSTSKEIHYPF